jgi:hypothetical protein
LGIGKELAVSERRELEWFTVRSVNALPAAVQFAKERRDSWNTFTSSLDKTGAVVFMLGWNRNPDSDWGRFDGNRYAVRFFDEPTAHQFHDVLTSGDFA